MKAVVHLTVEDTIEVEVNLSSLLSNYSKRLRQRRQAKGLSLVRLSQMSGVTGSAITRIEKGERVPSIDTVIKLERALEGKDDNTG